MDCLKMIYGGWNYFFWNFLGSVIVVIYILECTANCCAFNVNATGC